MIPLRFAAGDYCEFEGRRWRVAYVTIDGRSALIERGGERRMVDVKSLALALGDLSL